MRNAAREPEIADLAAWLALMGAMISGIETEVLTIVGDVPLSGAVHGVIPDRIELGTLACAAAITDEELLLKHGRLDLIGMAAPLLTTAGADLRQVDDGLVARRSVVGLTGVNIVTPASPGLGD